jgi:hypothetical protein
MCEQLLSRRRFNALFGTFSFAFPGISSAQGPHAAALAASAATEAKSSARTVTFSGGTAVPAVGQGSWHLGQERHPAAVEEEALRTGIALGMTLIDTSGNYGNGRSEELIGRAIAGQREKIFLVTKVEAHEVSGDAMAQVCDASRLGLGQIILTSICCIGPF